MKRQSTGMRRINARRLEWVTLALAVFVCVLAGLYLYRPRQGETVAIITVDGQELRRIDLRSAADEIFSIEQETGKPVSFEVLGGAIRFVQVTCPDHLCEKTGWCDAPGERAVCMPNRTALVCYDARELQ